MASPPRVARQPSYLLAYPPVLPNQGGRRGETMAPSGGPSARAAAEGSDATGDASASGVPALARAWRALADGATCKLWAADGPLACLATTATVGRLASGAVPWIVHAASQARGLRLLGVVMGAHLGASVTVTAVVLAGGALALAQLWRRPHRAAAGGELIAVHLAQAALGLAVAPGMRSLAAAWTPAGQLTLASSVALTLGLACLRARPRAPSLLASAQVLSAGLLCSPAGWASAAGMADETAVALCASLWAATVLTTSLAYAAVVKAIERAPTPYFSPGVLGPAALANYRFEAPAAAAAPTARFQAPAQAQAQASPSAAQQDATIFDVHPELWALARQLKEEIRADAGPFMGFRGQPVRHLYGPAGGGKTLSTLGFAREIGAYYRAADANELEADALGELPIAAINAVTLLLEADAFGRAHRRPVVLLLDEVDAMLPAPNGVQDNARLNRALGFNLLVHTLRLLQRDRSYVVLFTATNRYQAYEPLLRLLGQHGGVQLATPSLASKRKVFCAGLRAASRRLRETYGYSWAPALDADTQAIDGLLQRCARQGSLSARSMANLVQVALDAAVSRAGEVAQLSLQDLRANTSPASQRAADVAAYTYAAMDAELTQQFEEAQRRPPAPAQPQPLGRDSAPMSLREQQHLDRLLHDMGLRDTSAVQILQTLGENLAHEYVKPANAMRLATLKLRLANVVWLTLLHLNGLMRDPNEPRDHQQVYVPAAQGLGWLPKPSHLAAAALRAVRLQLRANTVVRRLLPQRAEAEPATTSKPWAR